MLETVRRFSAERLNEAPDADAVHHRHLEHYLNFAETHAPELRRSGSPAVTSEVDRELDNVRIALAWALERSESAIALRLLTALRWYWDRRGLDREARRWLEAALPCQTKLCPPLCARPRSTPTLAAS